MRNMLCTFLLASFVTLALQSQQQESGNSLKIDQNSQSNSRNKTLFYLPYKSSNGNEGRICLFDSHTNFVEEIARFADDFWPYEVATTKDKIFAIRPYDKSFEIFDLNTRQIIRGPDPPEWHDIGSVAYFKDKLYYLGGWDLKRDIMTDRVDILIDGKWQAGPTFPHPIRRAQTIICDKILYIIGGDDNKKIYRLSDDEREWIEIGEIPEERVEFGVASLNGKIYITGGLWNDDYYPKAFKSCLCFDPSAPVDSRTSRVADMNYGRYRHSLVAENGKLYAIGGFQKRSLFLSWLSDKFYSSIEEYDPQTNEWREVGELA